MSQTEPEKKSGENEQRKPLSFKTKDLPDDAYYTFTDMGLGNGVLALIGGLLLALLVGGLI